MSTTATPRIPATPAKPPPDQPPVEPETKGKFRFPSAFTVLVIVALAVWALALIIPSGQYRLKDGAPVPGTYHTVPAPQNFGARVSDLLLSPVNGLYGIQDTKTSAVGPDKTGTLFGGAEVFLFVLAIGAFITVMFATGALDRGIARLAHRTRDRGWLLIVAIMAVFSLLGSVEGMAEETLGFYGLVVPLMLAMGYDRMVAVGVIIVGAGIGVMGSTVNPFSIGIASGFANTSIGDGIVLRLAMWIVLSAVAIGYVVRYARRVHADPAASLVGFAPGDREQAVHASAVAPPPLTGRHKIVLSGVVLTFAFLIFSIIPWSGIFSGPTAAPYSWELDWWFPQLTAMFIVAAVLIGVVGGLGEKRLTDTLAKGAGDFIYPALVIVLARGVTVIMTNTQITDTVLHAMEKTASSAGSGIFAVVMFLINLPLAFLIPSTSGHATLAMPILAPLGDFAHVPRSLVVTAWNAASGWMNLFVPTTAVVVGGLALAKVGYNKYLRFLAPLLAILFVLTCAFLLIGAALS
ncbi:MAG: YfcC family protein [Actinomycetota bacterium]|nr:YfcC family protein [Actinomycetota bacterium]